MIKDAAISVRVEPALKEALEAGARADGVTFATYVWKILTTHANTPTWTLKDPEVVHTSRGTSVKLSVAEGWPLAILSPSDAGRLGAELQKAAEVAKKLTK